MVQLPAATDAKEKGNPMKLSSFKKAKYNPRQISADQMKALNKSIEEFGDLSGIVVNTKSNTIIAGHQRITTMQGKKTKVVTKEFKDNFGTVAVGHIEVTSSSGSTFNVPLRLVSWSSRQEKLANIAANNHGGEFDNQKLGKLLAELDNDKFDIELTGFTEGEFQTLIRASTEVALDKYTRKLSSPIYKITGKKPTSSQLYDRTKTEELQESIRKAGLSKNVTAYLMAAAERHTKFNFDMAAEFYAHTDKKTQGLMEDCALVIVDHNKAIEHGYLKLTSEIMDMVKNGE